MCALVGALSVAYLESSQRDISYASESHCDGAVSVRMREVLVV